MSENPTGRPPSALARLYDLTVLKVPVLVVLVTVAVSIFFIYYIKDFELDASADSIVLENDAALRYYDQTRQTFGSDDYVVLAVTPEADLFSDEILKAIGEMAAEFEEIERVESVTSILTVPLFHSPPVSLLSAARNYKTLAMEEADREMAREELTSSPLYREYLISIDGKTCAVQVNFATDQAYVELNNRRFDLRQLRRDGNLSPDQKAELAEVEALYDTRHAEITRARRTDIERIREIIAKYEEKYPSIGNIFLGGLPMIVADIISYIEKDIVYFGLGVVLFVLIMLSFIFRTVKWVILPTLTCVLTVLIMMGYLGLTSWRTTIVTSNFSSLLLIVTMSLVIHIVVRYRELHAGNPELSNKELIAHTVRLVAIPCLYTSLTTVVGFGSLIVSGIRPVMDFGLMMAAGLALAYVLGFVFFPAMLMLFPKGTAPPAKFAQLTGSPLAVFATFTQRHRIWVGMASIACFGVFGFGASRLTVENRFIDYFRASTPIYQGMTMIDDRLGGTTPLEVVLEAEGKDFWLEEENLAHLRKIHEWLDEQPETGKVISPDTMVRIVTKINNGRQPSAAMLNIIRRQLPAEIANSVIKPYATPDFDQVRIAMRVRESDRSLNRKELIARMEEYLKTEGTTPTVKAEITGMFVLYNNMLQSLFDSQIKTIVAVIGVIWLMFLILFRSPILATIGIIPNLLPVVVVLGSLGWLDIPLDMMTIMIAAVTFGIAVDDTIHYIHRFRDEIKKDGDYKATMYRCHNSIGRAMFYTSLTIIAGFSILTLSQFIPTIYFGLFTGLAMLVALLAAVTLLPMLIMWWKPFGPDASSKSDEVPEAA